MADSGRHTALAAIITKQFPSARITSAYRAGSLGSSGNADFHSSGNAVDIAPPNMTIFNWLVANYGASSEEIIYTPGGSRQIKNGAAHTYSAGVAAGHFDHIHWANTGKMTGGTVINASSTTTGGGLNLAGLSTFASFIVDGGVWVRVGVAFAGLVLFLMGMVRLAAGALPAQLRGLIP